jgi:5-methylcytosine-specific restriction protein A
MNSLSAVLNDLSSQLGVELIPEENSTNKSHPYSIRFSGLETSRSFSLVLARSWKTTQIFFSADAFAGEVIHYLCDQINLHHEQFSNSMESNQSKYSSIILEIDGQPFSRNTKQNSNTSTLKFEAEALTPESSIEYGLVNEKEEDLIRFTVALFASVLPIKESSFRNADEVLGYPEGAVSQVLVNKYERDPRNRLTAISIHGKSCMACGFNFEEKYGDLGDEYIIVHHVIPVSQIGHDYAVDPKTDLVTLCANCHAMVHRQDPPLSVEELSSIIKY